MRPVGPVRADIITRLCVFPVPPRTCDDIRTMTTGTKITHFSTVARPLEPRYFKNPSYLGSDKRSLSRYRLFDSPREILHLPFLKKRKEKDKVQRVNEKVCFASCDAAQHNIK